MDDAGGNSELYYIRARASLADSQTRVLKNADTFAVFDKRGTIRPLGFEDQGLFREDTRFLSRLDFRLNGQAPFLLSSNIKEENHFLVVDLTNPDFTDENGTFVPKGTIHLERVIFLWEGRLFERLAIVNFGRDRVLLSLVLEFDADFVDIFEVRGTPRRQRGTISGPLTEDDALMFHYQGVDGKERSTRITCDPVPEGIRGCTMEFRIDLQHPARKTIGITCECRIGEQAEKRPALPEAFRANRRAYERDHNKSCSVETSNEKFNGWINQSRADINMLLTKKPEGLYPYAGIPWFSTVFGRDGIITALQTLWCYPQIARGVLGYLAHTQAQEEIPERDAQPGKILHETRKGEMAAVGEIPFARYYGTIDATPLFVVLAGHYYERTGDTTAIRKLWPHIEAALDWIDRFGDVDGDGFVEYQRHAERGLFNQGWKDSADSIFHADGTLVEPPIALCEVQGYVYDAKLRAAGLAEHLGKTDRASELRSQASALRKKFQKAFWIDDLGLYAIALDGRKKPCRIKSSNAGHCLFSGIARHEHALAIAENFMRHEFHSGWGIRTLASSQARYNPMSYHNGSVWPHDNSLIAYGMARYGCKKQVLKVMAGLFEASTFLDSYRLPELFCGFGRRKGEGPTLYPVACDPQAWAAGTVFFLLQSCLGLSIHAPEGKVVFSNPVLPSYLDEVHLTELRVGRAILDISLRRHHDDVGVNVRRKTGVVEVITAK